MQIEVNVAGKAVEKKRKIFIACRLMTDLFFETYDAIKFVSQQAASGPQTLRAKDGSLRRGYVYAPESFFQESYLSTVLASVAVVHNMPSIVNYLQEVTLERSTNEHNGRQNVWVVAAIKE